MPRPTLRESNPELYALMKKEQAKLREEVLPITMLARVCPNCLHMMEYLPRGIHEEVMLKCPICKEELVYPTLYYRSGKRA